VIRHKAFALATDSTRRGSFSDFRGGVSRLHRGIFQLVTLNNIRVDKGRLYARLYHGFILGRFADSIRAGEDEEGRAGIVIRHELNYSKAPSLKQRSRQ
jgi:hypothetical protein